MSADFPNDGMCHETSGFLFNHPCDRFSAGKCSTCQKPLCEDHIHATPDGKDMLCTTCLKRKVQAERRLQSGDGSTTSSSYDRHYQYDHDHHAYFYSSTYYPGYGRHTTYHSSSSNADTSASTPQSPTPAGMGGGDFSSTESDHDPDDFTEGDAENVQREDDADFESDMGAS